jgi:hypothetical protein
VPIAGIGVSPNCPLIGRESLTGVLYLANPFMIKDLGAHDAYRRTDAIWTGATA